MNLDAEYSQPRASEVLDTARLRRRRRELRISSQDLSRAVGLPLASIRRIESGDGDALLTLAQLARLADTLALPVVDLLLIADADRSPQDSADDAGRVATLLLAHGALARDTIARTLGWKLPRTQRALRELQARAAELGVTVVSNGFTVALHRITDINSVPEIIAAQRRGDARANTPARAARHVRNLLHGDPDVATAPPAVLDDVRRAGVTDQAAQELDPAIAGSLLAALIDLAEDDHS